MNPDFPSQPREDIEVKITALLLGELDAAETELVRAAIDQDADLTRLHAELARALSLVREAVAQPAEPSAAAILPRLSEPRREALLERLRSASPATSNGAGPASTVPGDFKRSPISGEAGPSKAAMSLDFTGAEASRPRASVTWLALAACLIALLGAASILIANPQMGAGRSLAFLEKKLGTVVESRFTYMARKAPADSPVTTDSREQGANPHGVVVFKRELKETERGVRREEERLAEVPVVAPVSTSATLDAGAPRAAGAAGDEEAARYKMSPQLMNRYGLAPRKAAVGGRAAGGDVEGGEVARGMRGPAGGFGGGGGGGGGREGGGSAQSSAFFLITGSAIPNGRVEGLADEAVDKLELAASGGPGPALPQRELNRAAAEPQALPALVLADSEAVRFAVPSDGRSVAANGPVPPPPSPPGVPFSGPADLKAGGVPALGDEPRPGRLFDDTSGLTAERLPESATPSLPLDRGDGASNTRQLAESKKRASASYVADNFTDNFAGASVTESLGRAGVAKPASAVEAAVELNFGVSGVVAAAGASEAKDTLLRGSLARQGADRSRRLLSAAAPIPIPAPATAPAADKADRTGEARPAENQAATSDFAKAKVAAADASRGGLALGKKVSSLNLGLLTQSQVEAAPPPPVVVPAPVPQAEISTSDNAFSTFSLNVSDVSFKLAGASLEKGVMPAAGLIRTEEFLNAFQYRDPEPAAGVPVAFAWERSQYPFAHNRDMLRLAVRTAALGREAGRPLNLVLAVDNSGSMERGDRVQIMRAAMQTLATQLKAGDSISLVAFARTARLWLDGLPGERAGELVDAVGQLRPEGGTNLEDALRVAYETALKNFSVGGVNRVVLLTDGAANLGDVQPESLKRNVESYRKRGVALDCFGIGWEGFNDDLLEMLSRNGDGRYGFVNAPEEAAAEFAGQLAGAFQVAASDVKVQVEFNPRRVSQWRQLGYARHQLTKEQFRDNTVDAAELGAAETGNALYTLETNPRGDGPIATVRVRYKVPSTGVVVEHEWLVPYSGSSTSLEQSSPAMRLATTSVAFSEWLASSPYAAEVTADKLLSLFSGVPAAFQPDPRPARLEWMIRQAQALGGR